MQLLASFRPEDIEDNPPDFDYGSFMPRTAARAIVLDSTKVALIKVGLHGYYMLPGGGITDEDIKDGLVREVKEELGCDITITDEVGMTEVYFDRWSKKQTDHCYLADKVGTDDETSRTEFETEEGHEIVWVEGIDAAIEFVERARPAHRDGKLVQARDLLLLKAAKAKLL